MTFDEAIQVLSRDERFKATIYAMNTLLQQKGIYTAEEFEHYFCEHAKNQMAKAKSSEDASSEAVSAIR
jgi:hypothetical protein